jgi:hypothetical protein
MKKMLFVAVLALALVTLGRPAGAQCRAFQPRAYYNGAYAVPAYPYAYAYPTPVPYYAYPFPPAPSFGFGQGGIYGHEFVGRDETITSYTFPGRNSW